MILVTTIKNIFIRIRMTYTKGDIYNYWIGKNTNYIFIWKSYEDGRQGYAQKFREMSPHLIEITLQHNSRNAPLYNHEAVFKTLKGYFHDLKYICFSRDEYRNAGPLFLYSVDRGSGIWSFLGGLRELIIFGTTLADEKLIGQRLDNLDKKLEILRKHFGSNLREEDFYNFMNAQSSAELNFALEKIFSQGIQSIKISSEPFRGDIAETKERLIELKDVSD